MLIKIIKIIKFHIGLVDKRDLFPFRIVRMFDKSGNVPSNILYSAKTIEPIFSLYEHAGSFN